MIRHIVSAVAAIGFANGTFSVKQTDFGIKPISVGGAVNVKDALSIHFTIRWSG